MTAPDITIPDGALEAAAKAMFEHTYPDRDFYSWDVLSHEAAERWINQARAACRAMLKAWPGMCMGESECGWHQYIELPLTENINADG